MDGQLMSIKKQKRHGARQDNEISKRYSSHKEEVDKGDAGSREGSGDRCKHKNKTGHRMEQIKTWYMLQENKESGPSAQGKS